MKRQCDKTEGVNRTKSMRFYPFVFTSTDEGGIAAYYNYAGTDLCASREQRQACLSYAETKQSVRSNRVAARLGSGGLSYDATCVTGNGEVAKRSDELFWNGVKLLNEHKAKPEDFKEMSLVDAKGKEVDWLKKIDLDKLVMSWQLEAKIDPWKIHAVIDDNSYPAMPGNIRYENEPDVFFYHSDHLGGASWITDADGKPVQHLQYLPFGEPFVDQHPAGYQERFTFTGKERDEETGYGYFGARYMDYSMMTMWLSVDPMADKYPNISPYAYCAWNPVKLVDPDGREIDDYFTREGKYLGSDNANTNYVRIISEATWNSIKDENGNVDHDGASLVSHPFSEESAYMSTEAQLAVYQHYNPTEYKLDNLENNGVSYGMRSVFEYKKAPVIFVRLEGNASGIKVCDYADEIKTLFAHEKGHIDYYLKVGHEKYSATSNDVREQIAVEAEMNSSSWSGTREVYKRNTRQYGEKYGLKFNKKGEIIR